MKRISLVLFFLLAAVAPAVSQTQVRERRSIDAANPPVNQSPAVRNRIVGDTNRANHANREETKPSTLVNSEAKQNESKPAWGNSVVPAIAPPVVKLSPSPANSTPQTSNLAQPKLIKPTTLAVNNTASTPSPRTTTVPNISGAAVYRVGVGDVLDIRLTNISTRESTLYTVMKDGMVEYPLLPQPMAVSGLTTDEIARRLNSEIKVIRDASVAVSVRDFASHAVVISGLVDNPGRKVLRRESMPLFTILAEALPRSEAAVATIVRNGRETNYSISNNVEMATAVVSGDTIKISAVPKRFVYLGGDIAAAGEKEFRDGMTLTQALLAAGGPRDPRSRVKVARRGANGFLVTEEFSLPAIAEGKAPDPLIQAGDRIEVQRGVW